MTKNEIRRLLELHDIQTICTKYNIQNIYSWDTAQIYEFIALCLEYDVSVKTCIKYIDEVADFCIERFKLLFKYKTQNPSVHNSIEISKLKYGEASWECEHNKKFQKRKNCYDPLYISNRDGITIEDAKKQIDEYKKNKATSLHGFIKRHGDELGRRKYEQFQQTSNIFNRDNLILKYGEDQVDDIIQHRLVESRFKSRRCKEFYIRRGHNEEDAIQLVKEYQLNTSGVSYTAILNRVNGDVEQAEKIYNDISRKKDSSSLDYYISKYGDNSLAEQFYNERCKIKDSSSLDFHFKKYQDSEVALGVYRQLCKSKDVISIESFLRRGYDYDTAKQLRGEAITKRRVGEGYASKQSLVIINKFKSLLNNLNIDYTDFYGVLGSKEYFLYNKDTDNIYFYDYTCFINNKKVIIEYHGEVFHPNVERLTTFELENWQCVYTKRSWEECYQKDQIKKQLALTNNFQFVEIWSSDNISTIDTKFIKLINYIIGDNI